MISTNKYDLPLIAGFYEPFEKKLKDEKFKIITQNLSEKLGFRQISEFFPKKFKLNQKWKDRYLAKITNSYLKIKNISRTADAV